MKILYIIHDFLPKHQAGAEIYTYLLARELSQNHQVCLLFTEIQGSDRSYTLTRRQLDGLECIEVFRPPEAALLEEPYNDGQMDDIFISILEEYKPDIIHIQHLLYHSFHYPEIACKYNIPVVFTLHDYWLTCPRWGQRLQKNMEVCLDIDLHRCACCMRDEPAGNSRSLIHIFRHFLNAKLGRTPTINQMHRSLVKRASDALALNDYVDLFIAPSSFLKQEFVKFGIPGDKIVHSDNGSNTSGYARKEKHPGLKIRFGFIGTIAEHKGLHVLISAFNSIPTEKADLKIYGDLGWFPHYSARLKAMTRSAAITFEGPVPNDTVAQILSEIDILIVPSIWFENSPLTIHEAFLAGVPVIASDFGGMRDLVTDHVNGLLFKVNNPESLRKAIEEILGSKELLSRFSRNIPKVKSIKENGQEMERLYSGLLRQRQADR